ncbi:ComF family protein [Curtobacterium caseinilyticum]|uniref:Phosphoribosyltransferase family protein n=1 Tax=Curtobacterium caseinilyticum TaxID=3055137 RepID=A0ABT7TV72_9MICO|nr:phosphoribosyltransferase family protein [Curtobacterium caseinilyticum]MDM7892769.1 phosphoribosyltransferase family protein [Curtobacterium caseinilyticum]
MRDRPWVDAVLAVLGLVLPVSCVGCGAPDRAVCPRCRADLDARPLRTRLVAGVRLDAAFAYEGLVRTLVLELKLRGRTDLAPVLAARFGVLVRRALAASPGAVLVRVPPSRSGARRRGFDPVVLLLRRSRPGAPGGRAPSATVPTRERPVAVYGSLPSGRGLPGGRRLPGGRGLPVERALPLRWSLPLAGARTLRRVRRPAASVPTAPGPSPSVPPAGASSHGQKERTALERVEATVGTLRACGVQGRDVVVIDDVVTTGVTMAEAVRAVRAAGGRVVRCVALAEVEE